MITTDKTQITLLLSKISLVKRSHPEIEIIIRLETTDISKQDEYNFQSYKNEVANLRKIGSEDENTTVYVSEITSFEVTSPTPPTQTKTNIKSQKK